MFVVLLLKGMIQMFDADKYLKAQNRQFGSYEQALGEIRNGRKASGWIWYIFPQIAGLGHSAMSKTYALQSLDEAKQYLMNDTLRGRLIEISEALLSHDEDVRTIMGSPDDRKLQSCMTLFQAVDPDIAVFGKVLEKYFQGRKDKRTLQIIGADQDEKEETNQERVLREAEEYGITNIDTVSFEALEKTVSILQEMEKEGKVEKGKIVVPGMQLVASEDGPKIYPMQWCGQF